MPEPGGRLRAIDALRGVVMVLMALDHVRDFVHNAAAQFSPTDLTKTTAALFFTRWITHFCAPVFMLTAGIGAFLWWQHGHTRSQLSRYLFSRGLWLAILELTVMRLAYNFSFSSRFPVFLLVLWVLGACMIVLAALVWLPPRLLAILSIAVILLHNLLDGVQGTGLWNVIHQPGFFKLGSIPVILAYPLVPWFAVMALGFCFGQVFLLDAATRRKIILRAGWVVTAAFVVVRFLNIYGDPARWAHQKSALFTLLSCLNCTKYPPSLEFLLMTLGPALLALAWLDTFQWQPGNPLVVIGRVPLFFFIVHFYTIHALVFLASLLRYGATALNFLLNPVPSMGGEHYPPDFGYSLWMVYAAWIVVVVALYPLCRWFATIKATRRNWWLAYL